MLILEPQRTVTGRDQVSPLGLCRRARACIGKLVAEEIQEDEASLDSYPFGEEVQEREPVGVLVARAEPVERPMDTQVALHLAYRGFNFRSAFVLCAARS